MSKTCNLKTLEEKQKKMHCWRFSVIILNMLRMGITHDFWLFGDGETIALPLSERSPLSKNDYGCPLDDTVR